MRIFSTLIILFIIISGCSSSKVVEQYVNPETTDFKPQKILVIGLTPDGGLQRQFEYSMVKALEDQNVNAVKSVDLYGEPFEISQDIENNWENFQSDLLKSGFDSVLLSKITGQETRVTIAQSYRNLVRTFETFDTYYKENRTISESGQLEDYPVLNTESSLYCLCPDRENDLIWRGNIDIVNAPNSQKTIRDYVNTLVRALRKNRFFN
ncbi:hypothetical protein [Aequorivita viscosa]|uniref:Cardiolipin synthetase n=1 Tax=Aequorivita viscosa TaxID=797419 RepID=A0A1M6EAW2_9FLAO|nr:hypothetical protein [Aequorivita viscosa]SDW00726.1 hypothetical protein SAMN05216556_10194 [Aequorivita viscosa]SHI82644.1 hypothetical protein SAMN04487908_10623 [Aequorivita viscosa]